MKKRKTQNYSFAELGVEWGYETGEDGRERIYVMDVTGISYVDAEEEAERLCRENIDRWSPC